ncbi:hypothetical protein Bbelb_123010 [Branchiostoma belcheri]|nr:hypothetical protein Bbelb_123010 [Branchiostoma belcheri]
MKRHATSWYRSYSVSARSPAGLKTQQKLARGQHRLCQERVKLTSVGPEQRKQSRRFGKGSKVKRPTATSTRCSLGQWQRQTSQILANVMPDEGEWLGTGPASAGGESNDIEDVLTMDQIEHAARRIA